MRLIHLHCILCALLLLSAIISQTRAQFFTKTSKSIPRMGRRADPTLEQDDFNSFEDQQQTDKEGTTNLESLKALMSNLVEIPKFIQDSVLYYRHKLRKRSK